MCHFSPLCYYGCYCVWFLPFRFFALLVMNDYFEDVTMLMDDTSQAARYHWYIEPAGGVGESPGWRKIECFLLAPQSLAGVEAAHSQVHGPPAAKSDLVQGNIFSVRPCLQFRRPGRMLWNEVGRQTKRVVICPHCVAIDLLLLAAGFLEGTASFKKNACMLHQKKGSPGQTSHEAQLPAFGTIRVWINDQLIHKRWH